MKNRTVRTTLIIIYLITVLSGLLFAGMYLFRDAFMPYHETAAGRPWEMIGDEYQVLILALMRVSGGGWLATAVSIVLLLIAAWRYKIHWPYIAIPVIGFSALIPSLMATLYVKANSPAEPPVFLAALLSGLLAVAFILALIYRTK